MISDWLKGRGRSFRFAFEGLAVLWKGEPNTHIHAFFTVAAVVCGFLFRLSFSEWCAVLIVIGMVWCAEAFNTAIEHCVDLATNEIQPHAKAAKDVAAGAVLLAAFTSVVVGLIIFLPKFLNLLH